MIIGRRQLVLELTILERLTELNDLLLGKRARVIVLIPASSATQLVLTWGLLWLTATTHDAILFA